MDLQRRTKLYLFKTVNSAGCLFHNRVFRVSFVMSAWVILVAYYVFFLRVPAAFPINSLFVVENGSSIGMAAEELKERGIIDSAFWLKVLVKVAGLGGKPILAGDYFFPRPVGIFAVARRLVQGDSGLNPIRVSIPEGSNSHQVAKFFGPEFPNFKTDDFLAIAKEKEGYLFPDTYLFLPNVTANEVVRTMTANFDRQIKSLDQEIARFGQPLSEVVIMASLLEEEARKTESRQRIAGILWERMKIGMPLQVDAVFPYITGRIGQTVTLDDYKIRSPYNTYLNKGLPPGAISNPGLDAIHAAMTPIPTNYLFYLTDKNGIMRYAETFEDHLANKARYLR